MVETSRYRVLVSDPVSEEGVKLLKEVAQVDIRPDLSPQELVEIIVNTMHCWFAAAHR